MSESAPQSELPTHNSSFGWPIAATIVAVALIVGAVFVVKSCIDVPMRIIEGGMNGIGLAFQPQISIQQTISLAVRGLDPKLELKVGEREVDAIVERTSKTEWIGVEVGTTVTRLEVRGNRVQYIVPLAGIASQDKWEFVGNEHGGVLMVHLPSPSVDAQMVFVQTNPAMIKSEVDDQWLANVFVWQGDGIDETKDMIREEAVKGASANAYLREAEVEAAPKIEALLQSALQSSLRPNVKVKVVWQR